MSEQPAEATATEPEGTPENSEAEQPKPSETVDFWKQKAREQEKRAKDNADAAKRLAEIEEASKTDAEKSADRIKALETEVASIRTTAFKEAAVEFGGITQDDADLFLTASDQETLRKQLGGLKGLMDTRQKNGNHVPGEGTAPKPGEDTDRAFVRGLFSGD